jgi:hypothetical protein
MLLGDNPDLGAWLDSLARALLSLLSTIEWTLAQGRAGGLTHDIPPSGRSE